MWPQVSNLRLRHDGIVSPRINKMKSCCHNSTRRHRDAWPHVFMWPQVFLWSHVFLWPQVSNLRLRHDGVVSPRINKMKSCCHNSTRENRDAWPHVFMWPHVVMWPQVFLWSHVFLWPQVFNLRLRHDGIVSPRINKMKSCCHNSTRENRDATNRPRRLGFGRPGGLTRRNTSKTHTGAAAAASERSPAHA